ncbi:MAG: 4-hydroxy-3-methylbut-2-enyl diphosphate reductase, partial [Deltaproteobacteria bacterium]|nr:4-hydroxy-3-methylbut-2-enyl diphosphate reductase [Deltaproteobacteria bacterium]
LLANPRGFCAGVDRAIEIVELALARWGPPVYVRHEIVHNRQVVEALRAKGAVFVEDPADAPPGALLVFSAHGVSPAVREAAQQRGLRTLDATCPLVTKVHVEARRFAEQGFDLVLVGHAGHVEVEGTMGHAPGRTQLVETREQAERISARDPARLAVLTQTTLSVDDTREIVETLRARFPGIRLPRKDDICYATQNRQNAVKRLAQEAQLVLVVGAPSSSNSNRLVEIARQRCARAELVQHAGELQAEWLEGVECVGVSAGASAPELLVREVVQRLSALAAAAGATAEIEAQPEVDEGVVFQLPPELRGAGAREAGQGA